VADREPEFSDRESFEQWLADKPIEWAQALAARSALRVLPLVGRFLDLSAEQFSTEKKLELTLAVFRAGFISWAASKDPANNMTNAAAAATRAGFGASAAAYAVASARAADAAAASAYAASAAAEARSSGATSARAADAASGAASVAAVYVWQSVSGDSSWLMNHQDGNAPASQVRLLMAQPLWLADVRGYTNYKANIPPWVRKPLDRMADDPTLAEAGFGHWIAWYRKIIPHRRDGKPESHFGEELDISIATQPDEWWNRDPTEVNADIARWLDERQEEPLARQEPTVRQFILDFLKARGVPTRIEDIADAFDAVGFKVIPKTMRGELSRLASSGRISRLERGLYEHASQATPTAATPPPLPSQSPGLRFALVERLIKFVHGDSPGKAGDDLVRVRDQLPLLRTLAGKLLRSLERSEVPRESLIEALTDYRDLVAREVDDVSINQLYALSIIFRNELHEVQNPEPGANIHSLSGSELATANSLMDINDVFLLGTVEGRSLFEDAETSDLLPGEGSSYRALELKLLDRLAEHGSVMDAADLELLRKAVLAGGKGPRPDRSGPLAISSFRNAVVVVAGTAVLGGIGYGVYLAPLAAAIISFAAGVIGTQGMRNSKAGEALSKKLTELVDRSTVDFLSDNEELLRQIAGERKHYRWLHSLLDWAATNRKNSGD